MQRNCIAGGSSRASTPSIEKNIDVFVVYPATKELRRVFDINSMIHCTAISHTYIHTHDYEYIYSGIPVTLYCTRKLLDEKLASLSIEKTRENNCLDSGGNNMRT